VVEEIQNEDKVDAGERFFTSGEDRIFPKGFPVGTVVSAAPGQGMKDVKLNLSGAPGGEQEVLVVLRGVHQPIPSAPAEDTTTAMLPAPPREGGEDAGPETKRQTQADKVVQKYESIGKEQNHVYGAVGSPIPNFNLKPAIAPGVPPAATLAPPKAAPAPQTASPEPVLPLGAPRRKVVPPAPLGTQTQTSRPPATP
jgi:rod shape-determining protein MreC